jgi:hypothetical protein
MKWVSWLNVLAGAWLFVAPWALGYTGTGATEDHTLGVIVLLLALGSVAVPQSVDALAIMNLIAGIWVAAGPFVFGYDYIRVAASNDVGIGLLIVLLSAIRAGSARLLPGRRIMQ